MRTLTLRQIAALWGVRSTLDVIPTGYCVDSRCVKPGELFFALPGARADGHTFLAQVAAAGVCAAVVSRTYQGPDHGLHLIAVDDVLVALQVIARTCLEHHRCTVVAVTGSVGKTTTKEFLRVLLSPRYRLAASPGNSNSQIGLPLAILNHTRGDEELLILEMGMTLPGHIEQLVGIAPPDIALITTVALAHAGSFDSLEAIARTKAEIFTSPRTRLGLLPRDVAAYDEICRIGSCDKRSFGVNQPDADYCLKMGPNGLSVVVGKVEQLLGMSPDLPGEHNLHNLIAAISVARELDVPWEQIVSAIPRLELPERRLQTIERYGITFINDSYNAHPIAVKSALGSLPTPKAGGKRVAVLGTMPELGKFSDECHRDVAQHALSRVDEVICFGAECQPTYEVWQRAGRPVTWLLDRDKLISTLKTRLSPGDVVLIKGANTKRMWTLIDDMGAQDGQ